MRRLLGRVRCWYVHGLRFDCLEGTLPEDDAR